jgi:hypothetical protein
MLSNLSWYVEQEAKIQAASRRGAVGEYISPPPAEPGCGHIYVIGFDSGTVKVGRTINPKQRLATHARIARVHGVTVRDSWTSDRHLGADETERQLIAFCCRWGSQIDAEYFRDIAFENARAFAQLLADDATDRQLTAARAKQDAERRTYLNSLIDAAGNDLSMIWQEAHNRLGELGQATPEAEAS